MAMTRPDSSQILHTAAQSGAVPTDLQTAVNSPAAGFKNRVINGCMRVAQRPSLVVTPGVPSALQFGQVDRHYVYNTGTAGVTVQQNTTLNFPRLFITGATGVTSVFVGHRISAEDSRDLAGKTVTLSATLSSLTMPSVAWEVYYANASNTFGIPSAPARTFIASGSWAINTFNTPCSAQIDIPTAAINGIEIVLSVGAMVFGPWNLTELQLEAGSLFTGFERRPTSQETSMCQSFYQSASSLHCSAYADAAAAAGRLWLPFTTQMRATPQVGFVTSGGVLPNTGTISSANITRNGFMMEIPSSSGAGLRGTTGFSYTANAELMT